MALKNKNVPKKKGNSDDKYCNCHKLGHLRQNCSLSNRKLNKIIQQSWRKELLGRDSQKSCQSGGLSNSRIIQNRAYQASEKKSRYKDNCDSKSFAHRPIRAAFMIKE